MTAYTIPSPDGGVAIVQCQVGTGHRVGGTQSAEFLLFMLRKAENNAGLTGLNVDYLGIEYFRVNKAPEIYHWL